MQARFVFNRPIFPEFFQIKPVHKDKLSEIIVVTFYRLDAVAKPSVIAVNE